MDSICYQCWYPIVHQCMGFSVIFGQHIDIVVMPIMGCSSFLRITCYHILFSLALCNITPSENTTPVGQPYILATLPSFAADILQALQSKAVDIFSFIKDVINIYSFLYSSFLLCDYPCVDHMIDIILSSSYFPYHSDIPPYLCLSHSNLISLLSRITFLIVLCFYLLSYPHSVLSI
jgi:hypothetical protein